MLHVITLLLVLWVTHPCVICNGSLDFESTGRATIKYLLSPDWPELKHGLVVSWENSHAFFPSLRGFKNLRLSFIIPFLSPFHHCPSHISFSCSHTLDTSPHSAFLFLCLCVMHTNVWHSDMMMTQCSLEICLTPPTHPKKSLFDSGVRTQNTSSCPLLERRKLVFMQQPCLPHAGLSVNHICCSLILMRHNFELMARDDDNCERRLTSGCN